MFRQGNVLGDVPTDAGSECSGPGGIEDLVCVHPTVGPGVLLFMASFTPLRYPTPYPPTQAAIAQPAMKSHVSPVGIVHAMCIVAP